MKNYKLTICLPVVFLLALVFVFTGMAEADNTLKKNVTDCFESREGYTKVKKSKAKGKHGWPNIICSDKTGGVLWWGDPFDGTQAMGEMPIEADYSHEEAVVKPRIPQLNYYMPCTVCHNGKTVPVPKSKRPRELFMHQDIVPDALNMKHGKGAFWCLDCHSAKNRDKLINHYGDEISVNQPQKLCGKCHGQIYRDWRDGIHGKRIGSWETGGKRRWWVCTECHNPHDMEPPFKSLRPEMAPELPKGLTNRDHELEHGGGGGDDDSEHGDSSSNKGHH